MHALFTYDDLSCGGINVCFAQQFLGERQEVGGPGQHAFTLRWRPGFLGIIYVPLLRNEGSRHGESTGVQFLAFDGSI